MAGPLRPYPSPPSLMAVGTWQQNKNKSEKKVIFSIMARHLPPPLLLMARPLREDFFAAFLTTIYSLCTVQRYFSLLFHNA